MKAITPATGEAREYAPFELNLYHGCPHGCKYCYVPGTKHTSREEFLENGTEIKKVTLENLEHDLANWQGERQIVHLCFLCDPYPKGKDTTKTRQCLELFRKYNHPFQVLTKNGEAAGRDFDLYGPNDRFGVTLTCDNDADSLKWEPGAALWSERIEALRAAHEKGIKTWVSLEPVLDPGQSLHLIDLTLGVADFYGVGKLNHDAEREKAIDWLRYRVSAEAKLAGKKYKIKAALKDATPKKADFNNLPEEIKKLPQFCIRAEKQPYIWRNAKHQGFTSWEWNEHPERWLTFEEALNAVERKVMVNHNKDPRYLIDGMGFLMAKSTDDCRRPLGGDLDACRNPLTGLLSPWAMDLLRKIRPFYTEVSQSKCGVRYFVWGALPKGIKGGMAGNGPQNDLTEEDKQAILTAKPGLKEKLAKGDPAFNGLELYESDRHLAVTGDKLDEYCYPPEDRTDAMEEALLPYKLQSKDSPKVTHQAGKGKGLPQIAIEKVINLNGFKPWGNQVAGSHPIEGSSTGHNLVVNQSKGVWSYMHNYRPGSAAPGGDAWTWLACECGAVDWMSAGHGSLNDEEVVLRAIDLALKKGLIKPEDVGRQEEEEEGAKKDPITKEKANEYVMPTNPLLVLNLEPDNYLCQYMNYGDQMSDAYKEYWFLGGLFELSVVCDGRIYVHLRIGRIYPNVYGNIIGRSGVAHKSTVVSHIERLLRRLGVYHEVATEGSPEGWLESMSENSHAYSLHDESSILLARMKKHDYMAGMGEYFNKAYDGTTIVKRNSKKKKGEQHEWVVRDPYYNMLFATTPSKFGDNTSSNDVNSGFWVRFLHVYPNHDNPKFTPLTEASDELLALDENVYKRLEGIQTKILAAPGWTRMSIDPEGLKHFQKWEAACNKRVRKTHDDFAGQIMTRYVIYAMKLGMLFTMGRSDFVVGMPISEAHMREATRLIDEYFLPHALAIRDLIGEGFAKETNLILKIESVLRTNGGRMRHRVLLKKLHVTKKLLKEALETMELSGAVRVEWVADTRGQPREEIFLGKDDEDEGLGGDPISLSPLSPKDRTVRKDDAASDSKKIGGDSENSPTIHKSTTANTHIEDKNLTVPLSQQKNKNTSADLVESVGERPPAFLGTVRNSIARSRIAKNPFGDSEISIAADTVKSGTVGDSEISAKVLTAADIIVMWRLWRRIPGQPTTFKLAHDLRAAGHETPLAVCREWVARRKTTCEYCGLQSDPNLSDLRTVMNKGVYRYVCTTCQMNGVMPPEEPKAPVVDKNQKTLGGEAKA